MGARWYDPATGHLLSRDPFPGFTAPPQTQHPHTYVGNDLVTLTDASGEIVEMPWDLALVGLALLIFGWTICYYTALNPYTTHWEAIRVLSLDVVAIGLDVACLLIPVLPGGWGTGLRLAGGGAAVAAPTAVYVPQVMRVGQLVIKGIQAV